MARETSNPYGVFLMIEAARIHGLIDRELEYDLTWEKGVELYERYAVSAFNDDSESEYDCIFKWAELERGSSTFLMESALEQVKNDVAEGDLTAIEELLWSVPLKNLVAYLPESAINHHQ